jgi:hypothetical protein
MANNNNFELPDYFIVKLLRVPVEIHLNEILRALQGKLESILSIYRIYDYVNQRRCDEVVIIIRNAIEYQALKEMQSILINQHEVRMEFRNWFFGAASRPNPITQSDDFDIGPSPISLKLSGLKQVSTATTPYLLKLMTAFESWDNRDVTGITLIYDAWRDSIRPFGFVAFTNKASMMQFHMQRVRIFDEHIDCEASTRVPILLSEANRILLTPNPALFTTELCAANQLNDTNLERADSQLSLAAGVEDMNIDDDSNSDELLENEEVDESDQESVLSLDCNYDVDEDMNIVDKNSSC